MKKSDNPSIPWLRAVANNKILVIAVVCLSFVSIALAGAIVIMMPLKEKIPVYVEFRDGSNNFVVVERASKNIRSNRALISMFLRSYVSSRETIDKITESTRYNYVMSLSSPEIWQNFRQIYGNKSTGLFFQKGFKRSVNIIRDNSIAKGIHQVEVETVDTIDGRPGQTKSNWIITLQYGFSDRKVAFDERLQNPLGLQILKYSLTKRKV